jgi:hypothetical protein
MPEKDKMIDEKTIRNIYEGIYQVAELLNDSYVTRDLMENIIPPFLMRTTVHLMDEYNHGHKGMSQEVSDTMGLIKKIYKEYEPKISELEFKQQENKI